MRGEAGADVRTNWCGNYTYGTDRLMELATTAEVQAAVRATPKLRVLGSRHSFNGIADSLVEQIALPGMRSMTSDEERMTVTVGAAVRYGDLAPWMEARGLALHNLASLPHITVVGACLTATHGSGWRNGNLSSAVTAMEFVDGTGELRQLSRAADGDRFRGAVVSLGALGVVTRITLQAQPSFAMRQVVYLDLPLASLEQNFAAIFSAGTSVSLFTDWKGDRLTQVWIKSRVEEGEPYEPAPEFFGAKVATRRMHPILDHSAENATEQRGIPGRWYERMPHFRLEFTPSSGRELQTEYFVPRERGMEAIRAVQRIGDRIAPLLLVGELRTIAADDLWLSPCYQQDSMALHFTWKPEWAEVERLLPVLEACLEPFDVRPHWAKLFCLPPAAVRSRYDRLAEFRALAQDYDPDGRFRNRFLDDMIFDG